MCRGGGLALQLLVYVVDCEEVLSTERIFHGGFVGEVDFEGFADAVGGDFKLLGVFRGDRAVSLGGLEEVEDSEREALLD